MPKDSGWLIDDPSPFAPQQEWQEFEASLARLDHDDISAHSAYRAIARFWANEWNPRMVEIRRRVRERRQREFYGIQLTSRRDNAPIAHESSVNCQVTRDWSPQTPSAIALPCLDST